MDAYGPVPAMLRKFFELCIEAAMNDSGGRASDALGTDVVNSVDHYEVEYIFDDEAIAERAVNDLALQAKIKPYEKELFCKLPVERFCPPGRDVQRCKRSKFECSLIIWRDVRWWCRARVS